MSKKRWCPMCGAQHEKGYGRCFSEVEVTPERIANGFFRMCGHPEPQDPVEPMLIKKTRWYLAGPMTGLPESNYPAFAAAAAELRAMGFVIIAPHEENGLNPDSEWNASLRADLKTLLGCDGVILLPGWTKSRGARLEVQTALALEMPVSLYTKDYKTGFGKVMPLDEGLV